MRFGHINIEIREIAQSLPRPWNGWNRSQERDCRARGLVGIDNV